MRIFVIGSAPQAAHAEADGQAELRSACLQIGRSVSECGHELLICSPFEDAADLYVLMGALEDGSADSGRVHVYFPDDVSVTSRLDEVAAGRVVRHPQLPPRTNDREAWRYAWLLAQLSALDRCDVVIAIGGDDDGAAGLLLALARQRGTAILPFGFLGGTALSVLEVSRHTLTDRLDEPTVSRLWMRDSVDDAVANAERLVAAADTGGAVPPAPVRPKFFLSYSHARPGDADLVETLLRRRDYEVLRDEQHFGAGHELPQAIAENLARADVFIALWCAEYACSPHCYDEMMSALERRKRGLRLWILCLDDTRIVPREARPLIGVPARSRHQLEGQLLKLLGSLRAGSE